MCFSWSVYLKTALQVVQLNWESLSMFTTNRFGFPDGVKLMLQFGFGQFCCSKIQLSMHPLQFSWLHLLHSTMLGDTTFRQIEHLKNSSRGVTAYSGVSTSFFGAACCCVRSCIRFSSPSASLNEAYFCSTIIIIYLY